LLRTVAAFGRLDAAYNNAGIQSPAIDMADASGAEYDRVASGQSARRLGTA